MPRRSKDTIKKIRRPIDKAGEVLRHFCPAESPVETMVCTSDSKRLFIGQVATGEETQTLSVIDIESREIIKVFEKSDFIKRQNINSISELLVRDISKQIGDVKL